MNTQSSFHNGTLIIQVKGSVNGTEAPHLQEDINKYLNECEESIEQIEIDATGMKFIASMGLRVLLQLRKNEVPVRITGVADEVYNVFRMTGFDRIFEVHKALPQINIEQLPEVKGLKEVYQLTDETMVKVFPEGIAKAEVEQQVTLAKDLLEMGIPTPMTFDMMMVGERYALVFESIAPTTIDATALGTFVRSLHEHIIEPDGNITSAADREKKQIQSLQPYLGDDAVAKLLRMLSTVPEGSALLHGNISTQSIFLNEGMPMMTDMSEVGYGNTALDLAHLYAALPEEGREEFFDAFIKAYYEGDSQETIKRARQNIVLLSLIRNFTQLTRHGAIPTDEAVEQSRKAFTEQIEEKWDEILSGLHFKMDFAEEIRRLERKRFYLDGDVSIDWVAEKLGTNRHYVSDYFNKVLHTTFSDYINNLRLDYALRLMRDGKTSATQIAFDAGFNSDHTFRRLFKQRFGCSPSQYKPE